MEVEGGGAVGGVSQTIARWSPPPGTAVSAWLGGTVVELGGGGRGEGGGEEGGGRGEGGRGEGGGRRGGGRAGGGCLERQPEVELCRHKTGNNRQVRVTSIMRE